jgi:CBS domain containing-hemolysin-like protein
MFQLSGQQPFLTTVGKLNFFRWAIEKGIIDYIKLNLTKIEKEMNTNAREQQKLRKQLDTPTATTSTSSTLSASTTTTSTATTRRRARMNTVHANGKSIEKHDLQVEVRFD